MANPAALTLMLLAAVPALAQDGAGESFQLAQVQIQQRLTIRIPRLPIGRQPIDAPPLQWVERKGPKCVPLDGLEGATISGRRSIDLSTDSGERLRALLDDDCPAMDYASGFYLRPTADGMVCADRDAIRVRSGGSCPIEGFRTLIAKR